MGRFLNGKSKIVLATPRSPHLRKGLVQISDHAVHLDSGDDLHRGLPNPGSGWIGASPVTSPSGCFSYSYGAMENTMFNRDC